MPQSRPHFAHWQDIVRARKFAVNAAASGNDYVVQTELALRPQEDALLHGVRGQEPVDNNLLFLPDPMCTVLCLCTARAHSNHHDGKMKVCNSKAISTHSKKIFPVCKLLSIVGDLQIDLRVAARVVHHDRVRSGQIEPRPTRSCGDEVEEVGAALGVEGAHVQLPSRAIGGAVKAEKAVATVSCKLRDGVQRLEVLQNVSSMGFLLQQNLGSFFGSKV